MQTVRRLVPNFIIEKHKANEMTGSFEGAAIFADISGFSNMVDTLSTYGQQGAETLADLMRQVFEPLVNAVYEQGGFVIGYAGDAFNAVFPADQAPVQAAQRCLSALMKMQTHLKAHPEIKTPFGTFPFALKAGMGYGEIRWQMFQSKADKHLTYWMRGEALNRAVFAEARANPGDIVVDPVAFEHLKDIVESMPAKGVQRILGASVPLPTPLPITEPEQELFPANHFFSDELLQQPIVGEFRHVVNLFIDIPLNISDEALATPFMETVYDLQEQYGGFFLRPEIGDKGFNLLIFWGAPTAHERDIERALNFMLDLSTRTKLTLRAGISYHTAYAGFMGAPLREDYTTYGWGITLAARLMAYAHKGEFWISEDIARRAQHDFDLKYLGESQYKGFAKKQRTYQLLGKKSEKQAIYPGKMIGRSEELVQLKTFFDPLHEKKFAGALIIEGEAGIGKSRLLYAYRNAEEYQDLIAEWIEIRADELIHDAFNPFKPWLRKRFGINERESDAKNWATFTRAIEMLAASLPDPKLASELRRTDTVLASLVNLFKPETFYETLDAKARYENTFTALSTLLFAESFHTPVVIFLEDAHWLDEDSATFLAYFMHTLSVENAEQHPVALIATQRPGKNPAFAEPSYTQKIMLGKLSRENIQALAGDILDAPIDNDLVSLLEKRAEGNPFFSEQILRYLSENKLLILDEKGIYSASHEAQTSLPLDIRAVMIARLDRLTQKVRETVQTASVLGREFIIDILLKMLHSQREKLPDYVHKAEQASIWAHISEIEYLFHHALLRDAAYSMQLEARQRDLHILAFEAMEELYQEDIATHYGELAYHAEKGGLKTKALHYLISAGDLAMSAYQNRPAIDYFTRALALLPKDELRTKFELLIKRVECLYNIGDPKSQEQDLKEMENLAQKLNDNNLLARTYMRHVRRYSALGNSQKVIQYVSDAKELAQSAQADEVLMSTYISFPDALSRTGKPKEAHEQAMEGLAYARKTKNRYGEAHMLTALGLATLELEGPIAAQKYQEEALTIARELKNRYLEGKVLNNLANAVGLAQGDYHTAYKYFLQALSVFQEQGNQTGKGLALANLGWAAAMLGDYETAITYYKRSLLINKKQGNLRNETYTYINMSASAIGQGVPGDALSYIHKGLDFSTRIKDRIAEGWAYFYLGHAHLLNGQFVNARRAFMQSLCIRKETKAAAILLIETQAGLAEAHEALGNFSAASSDAEAIYQYMQGEPSFEGAEEPLRIYRALYRTLKQNKDERAKTVIKNANQLLNEQVSKLRSKEAQYAFVENVPWRRAIKKEAES